MSSTHTHEPSQKLVRVDVDGGVIEGNLDVPPSATGFVLFAHGSGSSRHSPRNRFVAKALQEAGLATLLIDLLTPDEERVDDVTAQLRFDIDMLARRLLVATDWLAAYDETHAMPIGYFGASTGAAAALVAAAERPEVAAVVSRGGRPDLAGKALTKVHAATLLIVGGADYGVIELNERAYDELDQAHHKQLKIVPGATHLFQEPGTLEAVADLAAEWFTRHFASGSTSLKPR